MTDEELAEAYIDEHSPCFKEFPKAPRGALKQAYLAGLKAGREEAKEEELLKCYQGVSYVREGSGRAL